MPHTSLPTVIVIIGPTASGKTTLADALFSAESVYPAFRGKAEVISADSMQVYRGQDIGTAKPDAALCARLPHHGIDLCSSEIQFSAGDFVQNTERLCAEIVARNKIPIILGGTAFYIRNFLYGLPVTPESDDQARSKLKERMRLEGSESLWKELQLHDPVSAARIHINDEYRIIRALEVWYASGMPLSSYPLQDHIRQDYRFLVIGIERSRTELYARINDRVDEMFRCGLVREIESLLAKGYAATDPGMQAIGYREFFMAGYSAESADLVADAARTVTTSVPFAMSKIDAVAALIKKDTRRYAKRQLTFFKAFPDVTWFSAGDANGVYSFLQRKYCEELDCFANR